MKLLTLSWSFKWFNLSFVPPCLSYKVVMHFIRARITYIMCNLHGNTASIFHFCEKDEIGTSIQRLS